MSIKRKPFQGVYNIVRFNWHFYVLALCFFFALLMLASAVQQPYKCYITVFGLLFLVPIFISLLASYYVYDYSNLYKFDWIASNADELLIVNIHAGFDETSEFIAEKYPKSKLMVFDFYDPAKHTEVSIKRARKAYPPYHNTKQIDTSKIPIESNTADVVFVILATHEIRNEQERTLFLKELHRIVKPTGTIQLVEHIRDLPNFLAYNIGFLHFYSAQSWKSNFKAAELTISKEEKLTPFISNFKLQKNGNTY
ncbi:MAG: methyltransferase domain-containing protein [Bacteroidetes bacterium]|nr:methyltransferase domain-containing protein [Bacteroidota bacterium]